jgi:hypothetical protein
MIVRDSFRHICGNLWGVDFPSSSQNLLGTVMRRPVRTRLSFGGGELLTIKENWFLANRRRTMKRRALLELDCGSTWDQPWGLSCPYQTMTVGGSRHPLSRRRAQLLAARLLRE